MAITIGTGITIGGGISFAELVASGGGGGGLNKAIFGFGYLNSPLRMTNLVSDTGVVATDVVSSGTSRRYLAAAGYGTDKALFGYGFDNSQQSMTNKVSNTGVVASDTTGVGQA
jgi:hypothetical protein